MAEKRIVAPVIRERVQRPAAERPTTEAEVTARSAETKARSAAPASSRPAVRKGKGRGKERSVYMSPPGAGTTNNYQMRYHEQQRHYLGVWAAKLGMGFADFSIEGSLEKAARAEAAELGLKGAAVEAHVKKVLASMTAEALEGEG